MGGGMKQCPFCRSDAVNVQHPTGRPPFIVGCKNCGAQTKFFASSAEAIAAWNRRSPDTELVEVLELINMRASPSPARTFDDAIRDLELIAASSRALLSRIREGGEG